MAEYLVIRLAQEFIVQTLLSLPTIPRLPSFICTLATINRLFLLQHVFVIEFSSLPFFFLLGVIDVDFVAG